MEECYAKPATLLLTVTPLHGCFARFLNCTNGAKSCNMSDIYLFIIFPFPNLIKRPLKQDAIPSCLTFH